MEGVHPLFARHPQALSGLIALMLVASLSMAAGNTALSMYLDRNLPGIFRRLGQHRECALDL